ncbi:MAG: hypothetical protein ABSF77_01960 [Spirochaetia bacterium]|jgi:outer membrane protein assembly factor BamD (BamD/ComL family)
MRRHLHAILFSACCAATLVLCAACATETPVIPEGLSAVEIFQRAQDAADKGNYKLGIAYYSVIQKSYPDDIDHVIWAAYEIAFLNYKMGKYDVALSLVNDLLARYEKEGDALPPAPRVLAQKLKTRLEALLPKKTEALR